MIIPHADRLFRAAWQKVLQVRWIADEWRTAFGVYYSLHFVPLHRTHFGARIWVKGHRFGTTMEIFEYAKIAHCMRHHRYFVIKPGNKRQWMRMRVRKKSMWTFFWMNAAIAPQSLRMPLYVLRSLFGSMVGPTEDENSSCDTLSCTHIKSRSDVLK